MDQHLLFLLNQHWTHPFLDRALGTLSSLDFWVPLLVLGAVYLIWKHRIRGAACVLICVFGVGVNETLIAQPLKKMTHRARPHQTMQGVRRVDLAPLRPRILAVAKPMQVSFSGVPDPSDTTRRSFPSAHVLNATTLGIVLALFLRVPWWLLLPPLMAWSRVYTGAHWPTDVTASLVIGIPFNLALLWLCEKLWQKRIPLWRPDWTRACPNLVFQPKPPLP